MILAKYTKRHKEWHILKKGTGEIGTPDYGTSYCKRLFDTGTEKQSFNLLPDHICSTCKRKFFENIR